MYVVLAAWASVALSIGTQWRQAGLPLQRHASAVAVLQQPVSAQNLELSQAAPPIGYDLLQGEQVRWRPDDPASGQKPPTAVLVHGILGSRRNLFSFGKRLVQEFPTWQFLLVDLRCHGQTATMAPRPGSNTVESAAADVISLLNMLKLYPAMLLGHSFGGKVVMEMVLLSGRVLPRPVQVWVLDTIPGDAWRESGDHPRDTIEFVRTLHAPFDTRKQLVDALVGAGFSAAGSQWMATNLKPLPDGRLGWTFDLAGIAQMYASYEQTSLWYMLENQPKGLAVDFVRAERSAFVWTGEDVERIDATGAHVHVLRDAGHWVHIDNPDGLLDILTPSFQRLSGTVRS